MFYKVSNLFWNNGANIHVFLNCVHCVTKLLKLIEFASFNVTLNRLTKFNINHLPYGIKERQFMEIKS